MLETTVNYLKEKFLATVFAAHCNKQSMGKDIKSGKHRN